MLHPDTGADPARPPNPAAQRLLDGLTPEQAQAVCHGEGPLLVLAGPGAGKTKTLTHRVAHLLATGRAQPWEILAVTFSVRAAGELRLRLAELLGETAARGVTAATFHSVCARLLREHTAEFGRTEGYTIYDQADIRRVIDWVLSDQQRSQLQQALADHGQPASTEVLGEISMAKNRLLTPDRYARAGRHPAAPLVAAVWDAVDVELQRSNAFDFDDLLLYTVRLLVDNPHRLAFIRQRWRWLLVDEYQDTNEAQAALVALLAGPAGNVSVVGDDDQLVYGWRGAEPRNILAFGDAFPSHRQIVLGCNFRCRAEILNAAVGCVAHNHQRAAKALLAMRGAGGQVEARWFAEDRGEAHWVTAQIAQALSAGTAGPEILVLARTAYATIRVQHALAQAGIAHRVLGSLGLYERSEVKDAIAYLTLLANPIDAQAFARAIRSPKRGVGDATANRVVAQARERGTDLIAACAHADQLEGIRSQTTIHALARFGGGLEHVRAELAGGRSLGHAVVGAMTIDGGLVRAFQARRDRASAPEERRDAERLLEDLRSLCRAAQSFEEEHIDNAALTAFLEHAAGLHAQEVGPDQEDRRVTVSTVHRAKGTEAKLVIVVGCEEQLLPSWRSLSSPDASQLEEERRVFYVAATRAKDRLVLCHAAQRGNRATAGPSRFLTEAGLIAAAEARAA